MEIKINRVLSPMYHLEFSETVGTPVSMDKRKFRALKKALKQHTVAQAAIQAILDKSRK